MSRRVTIADVAELAGVHKATVSRALNTATEHQVNAATVKRVQRAASQLGYIPNIMARGLRTSLSMTVGVLVPDLTNPLFPPILRGVEHYLSPKGYTALLANTDGRDALERAAFNSLVERRVDGFIFATGHAAHPLLSEAHERGLRAVLVNRGSNDVPYPLVTGDDATGIRDAVNHLYELGHRRLLHVAGPSAFSTSVARSQAFEAVTRSRTDVESSTIEAAALTIDAGQAAMDGVLASGMPAFTAVVAANDLLALGVIRSLHAHGLDAPHDVSLTGFNDMPFAEDFNPPLTTVRVPNFDMGVEAARLLLEGIETGAQTAVTVRLPVSLVVRGSTAPPRSV